VLSGGHGRTDRHGRRPGGEYFMGGRLTIKGPAAGLITVCGRGRNGFEQTQYEGVSGVQLACGAVIVMSIIQIVFGFLKFGSYSDFFFPHSAVHGMLAAIGVLIFAKQFRFSLALTLRSRKD